MKSNNKIIFNTLILYLKLVITILISLYSTRVILLALGEEDYGVFSIVAVVISFLAFFNVSLSTTTQRFISFTLGLKDGVETKKVFASSILLHIIIGLLLLILFETFGLYFLNNELNIPVDRIQSANYLYHFIVASTVISIISVPYDGLTNAHENMLFLSLVEIFESIGKLLIAIFIIGYEYDKLIIYGFLLLILTIVVRLIKLIYCKFKYKEASVVFYREYDFQKINEMISFAGWSLFGVLSSLASNQGIAILLNLFFGSLINAAFGIATQVNGQLSFLSQTLLKAIRPQMMKSEGEGDRNRLIKLSLLSSRFSFHLYCLIAIPLYFELEFILEKWLVNVPDHTLVFCRMILIMRLIQQFSMGIMSAVQAIGKLKFYQLFAGSMQLMIIPIGYYLLHLGYQAYSVLLVLILIELLSTVFRIYYFKILTGFSKFKYVKDVLIKPFLLMILSVFCLYIFRLFFVDGIVQVVLSFSLFLCFYTLLIYFFDLKLAEKQKVQYLLKRIKIFV